ncbi:peptidylprolyl isomerase, partial [Rhizobium ruizarguesonis]
MESFRALLAEFDVAREKAYDGVVFHRVIQDFMAQTGDV